MSKRIIFCSFLIVHCAMGVDEVEIVSAELLKLRCKNEKERVFERSILSDEERIRREIIDVNFAFKILLFDREAKNLRERALGLSSSLPVPEAEVSSRFRSYSAFRLRWELSFGSCSCEDRFEMLLELFGRKDVGKFAMIKKVFEFSHLEQLAFQIKRQMVENDEGINIPEVLELPVFVDEDILSN